MEKKKGKACLIFDYDGTIHNTMGIYEPAIRDTYEWLISEGLAERKELSSERISKWLGYNVPEMWNDFQPQLSLEMREKAGAMVGTIMRGLTENNRSIWYEGAEETLEALKKEGYNMLVLSNCTADYRDTHTSKFEMGRFFDEFVDCESYGYAPKTEIAKEIVKKYEGPYIVIGDRKHDLACARSISGKAIGCAYGFGDADEIDSADVIVNDISELPEAIKKLI